MNTFSDHITDVVHKAAERGPVMRIELTSEDLGRLRKEWEDQAPALPVPMAPKTFLGIDIREVTEPNATSVLVVRCGPGDALVIGL